MNYITIHSIVPTQSLEVELQHIPYPVAGTVEIREGMSYRELFDALDDALSDDVDIDLIDGLVLSLLHEDPRHYAVWASDVYELQPFDDTYSVIVTGGNI